MSQWQLHSQLANDTLFVAENEHLQIRLLDESRYPWLIIVPKIPGAVELFDLPNGLQSELHDLANAIGKLMLQRDTVSKLNMGYLGNVVPQLHYHVLGRNEQDPAWPGPVWGHSPREAIADSEKTAAVYAWREACQALL